MNKTENNEIVSIIVPIYNVEKYLNRCINSIINQTYKNLEIILVDDGSTDNCSKMCDEYYKKDKRVKVIHKKNGGLSDARNKGLEVANGEWISFVDSDDYIENNFIEELYKSVVKNRTKVSMCNVALVDENEQYMCTWKDRKITKSIEVQEGNNLIYDAFCYSEIQIIVVWNKLYNKSIFNSLRFSTGKVHEDEDFTYKALYKNKVSIVNDSLYNYMQNTKGIMQNFNIKRLDILDIMDKRNKFYYEKNENKLYIKSALNSLDRTTKLYDEACRMLKDKEKKYAKNKILKYFNIFYKEAKKNNILTKTKLIEYLLFKYLNFINNFINNFKKFLVGIKKGYLGFTLKYYFYILKTKLIKKELIFLLNAPSHGNLGDHAIALAEEKFLKNKNLKYFIVQDKYIKGFLNYLKHKDNGKNVEILYTGGGYLGTVWENEQINLNLGLKKFKKSNIIIFPQSVFYDKNHYGMLSLSRDNKYYNNCNNITLYTREKLSYNFAKQNLKIKDIKYFPDFVLYLNNIVDSNNRRNGIGLVYRQDKENVIGEDKKANILEYITNKFNNERIEYFDTVIPGNYSTKSGQNQVIKLLKKFASKKLIITDRLHGMIFATITNTPCIALANSTGKVKGVYDWIKSDGNDYIFFAENLDDFEKIFKKIDVDKEYKYNNKKIMKKINEIKI